MREKREMRHENHFEGIGNGIYEHQFPVIVCEEVVGVEGEREGESERERERVV